MPHPFRLALIAAALTALAVPAVAQIMAPGGLGVCRTEIRQFCRTVEAGAGKRLECLAANREALSAACAAVVDKRGPGRAAAKAAAAGPVPPLRACRPEIQAHCASVLPGGGARIACLRKNADKLRPTCSEALTAADAQRQACAADGDRLCGTARGAKRLECLMAAKDQVSPACGTLLQAGEARQTKAVPPAAKPKTN
jgi:hypothetical protein